MSGARHPGSVRIVGGRLRGSRLPVPDAPGLRPTSDRVRETLFNWLQHEVHGARCLDAFAGTGALGFEAASRGAGEVVMIERDPALARALAAEAARLHADAVRVECADSIAWLRRDARAMFDVVFLDPPFEAGLWQRAVDELPGWLAPRAWVYVESPRGLVPEVPGWRLHREGATRDVRYALYRHDAQAS